ncbi:MAG: glycosyltransferase [Acidimicrobiia bacterium]
MRVRVVSPWYPDYASAYSGVFVEKQVAALREAGHEVFVDVPHIFPAPPGPIPAAVTQAIRSLAGRSLDAMYASWDGVTWVPTPVPSRGGHLGRAEAMGGALGTFRDFRPETADLVHAHLGMPTGWAVSQLIGDRPLVVTEHQSTLSSVLAEPRSAHGYREVLRRADAFICVSDNLRTQIAETLGDWVKERIEVVPNIVDLTGITFVERPDPTFQSWIYVGGLVAHKGVQTLMKAFAEYVSDHDPHATLTLVGDGPLRKWIETFAASKGLGRSVELAGPVEHVQLGHYLGKADLMVHLSPAETFGIAPLEAIGAGLPVVSLRNGGALDNWGDIEAQCGSLLDLSSGPEQVAGAVAQLRDAADRLDPVYGRRVVEERFSAPVVARRLSDIYERVIP